MDNPVLYTVGGNVQAGGGIYIERKADNDLYTLCREHLFAYVLAPRQVGKSSLMVHTAERLAQIGVRSIIIDLSEIGAQIQEEEWYLGLITNITDQLNLTFDIFDFWQSVSHLGMAQRLYNFFSSILLSEISDPIVIFIDEIDTTLSLTFTDDFFALIRSMYDSRARHPDFQRLSFVLIGVATPGDLIRDYTRTPFNIGQAVELLDFTFQEANLLLAGLRLSEIQASQVLSRILKWTGGHPYLTQRLIQALAEMKTSDLVNTNIDRVVQLTFFDDNAMRDNNLQFVRDMMVKHEHSVETIDVLSTYYDIRRGKRIADDEHSRVKLYLKLTGIVRRVKGELQVRNGIYWYIFDIRWAKSYIPINWRKRLQYLFIGLMVLLVITILIAGFAAQYAYQEGRAASLDRQKVAAQEVGLATTEQALVVTRTAVQADLTKLAQNQEAVQHQQTSVIVTQTAAALAVNNASAKEAQMRLIQQSAVAERDKAVTAKDLALQQKATADASRRTAELAAQTATEIAGEAQATSAAAEQQAQTALALQQTAETAEAIAIKAQRTAQAERMAALAAIASMPTIAVEPTSPPFAPTPAPVNTTVVNPKVILSEKVKISILTKSSPNDNTQILSVTFSPDDRNILAAGIPTTASIWDADTGTQVRTLSGHTDAIQSAVFNPGGTRIVSGSNGNKDGDARVWDAESGQTILILPKDNGKSIISTAFSPDGRTIATGGQGNTVHVWNAERGILLKTLLQDDSGDSVRSVVYSPDGEYLLAASTDGIVRIWDTRRYQEVGMIDDSPNEIWTAAFSPNGRLIVTAGLDKNAAGKDNSAKVWNIPQNQTTLKTPILSLSGHTSKIRSAVFSPNGKMVMTACEDGHIRLWEITTGQKLADKNINAGKVYRAVFDSKGSQVASSDDSGSVRIWKITSN